MKRSGPDSLKSWVIAFACCFMNMMTFGMIRLNGVLFVTSVPMFNVSREEASFPYTFACFMRNITGPLVGFLGHRFGVRAVTTFGSILGAIGIGTCYFAQTIDTITVLWGAVFGFGFGLTNVLLPVSINQYFEKHRATASGISYSGACLGSFILPPVVEVLLNIYGLSGTYLFLAGFLLNCVPAALLLKKPNFIIKRTQVTEDCEKQSIVSSIKVKLYTLEDGPRKSLTEYNSDLTHAGKIAALSTEGLLSEDSILKATSEPLYVERKMEKNKFIRQINPMALEANITCLTSQNTNTDGNSNNSEVLSKSFRSSSVQYEKPTSSENFISKRKSSSESLPNNKESFLTQSCKDGYLNYGYENDLCIMSKNISNDFSNSIPQDLQESPHSKSFDMSEVHFKSHQPISSRFKSTSEEYSKQNTSKSMDFSDTSNSKEKQDKLLPLQEKAKKTSPLAFISIIFDPMFILIAITSAIYIFTFITMVTIIIDFARDMNIETSNEKYLLMTLSVGELLGRLGLGWITDRGYMTTTNFAASCFACQAVTVAATVWTNGFKTLMVTVTLYGFSEASLLVIFPVIVAQYIDQDKQTVAIPSSSFLSGPLCLSVAPLIGYFRDHMGSYDYIFYGLGILSLLCSFSWVLAPCIARYQKKR